MRLYERLKELRLSKNITQNEIAKVLQIHPASYSNYEIGKREPDFDTIIKIADFYNISLDYIFNRNNNVVRLIEEKIEYKSSLHKDLISMINYFDKEDLLMLKGYMTKINEKYINNDKEEIG